MAFLDTSFVVALACAEDEYHSRAALGADSPARRDMQVVTIRAVLLEVGSSLSSLKRSETGINYLTFVDQDSATTILPITESSDSAGFRLIENHRAKQSGRVDCFSFAAMQELPITQALIADYRFQQAGSQVLLLEAIP